MIKFNEATLCFDKHVNNNTYKYIIYLQPLFSMFIITYINQSSIPLQYTCLVLVLRKSESTNHVTIEGRFEDTTNFLNHSGVLGQGDHYIYNVSITNGSIEFILETVPILLVLSIFFKASY